jgi:hypothetical protein
MQNNLKLTDAVPEMHKFFFPPEEKHVGGPGRQFAQQMSQKSMPTCASDPLAPKRLQTRLPVTRVPSASKHFYNCSRADLGLGLTLCPLYLQLEATLIKLASKFGAQTWLGASRALPKNKMR